MLSLNFLGALSSLLPGYIQGRRQAIQDNWQDLQNYNNIQQGQLNNAFTEATWQPRLDIYGDQAINSGLNTINNGMNAAIRAAYFPGQYYQGNIWSEFAPIHTYQDNWLQLLARQQGQQLLANNPRAYFGMQQQPNSATNPTPSGIGG